MVDVERLHLSDEVAHSLQRGSLAARVELERPAATLERGHQHLAAVGGEHARGCSIDVREERVLHASGEQRDPHALAGPAGVRWRGAALESSARRSDGCHVVEAAQGLRHQALQRRGSAARLRSPSAWVTATAVATLRIRRGWGSTAKSAARDGASAPSASEAPLDLRTDLLDEAVVLHSGRARIDARHAAETRIPVAHHLGVHADLATRREIHEQDATTRRIHLLAPEQVGRARGEAESAMDAVRDQRRIRRMVVVKGPGRRIRRAGAPGLEVGRSSPPPPQMPPT